MFRENLYIHRENNSLQTRRPSTGSFLQRAIITYHTYPLKHSVQIGCTENTELLETSYGKDVLGAVRLEAARTHQTAAKRLQACAVSEDDPEQSRRLKSEAKKEQQHYSRIKKLRWTLLTNGEKLPQDKSEYLEAILSDHADLAVCYAMKEELCALFKLSDPTAAADGWRRWFDAALSSGIPALVRFDCLKRSRINGLISHASHPISTGKLEGFNNKIKVAKRISFGYRDDDYFFTLVRYLALPAACRSSHSFP